MRRAAPSFQEEFAAAAAGVETLGLQVAVMRPATYPTALGSPFALGVASPPILSKNIGNEEELSEDFPRFMAFASSLELLDTSEKALRAFWAAFGCASRFGVRLLAVAALQHHACLPQALGAHPAAVASAPSVSQKSVRIAITRTTTSARTLTSRSISSKYKNELSCQPAASTRKAGAALLKRRGMCVCVCSHTPPASPLHLTRTAVIPGELPLSPRTSRTRRPVRDTPPAAPRCADN